MPMSWLSIHKKLKLLFLSSQNIDILLVSKIHFRNKNYCRVPGYTLYQYHVPVQIPLYLYYALYGKAHGGTVLIIRSNIKL